MGIKGKMKDNMNARRDLKIIYNHPELELGECKLNVMPKAVYTLGKEQKRRVCEWICGLKFSDRYASNLACCVDMTELWMHSMNSHDCHVFMQKLISDFREMLPEHIWSGLIEVSLLFQSTYSTTLDVHKLHELKNSIAIIMCNLKKIFPPTFFDLMEHLIVHLPYEAQVGGPVQYMWMYPFERFLRELKKVKNKNMLKLPLSRYTLSKKSVYLRHSTLSRTCIPNEVCLEEMMSSRAVMMESRRLFSIVLAELLVPRKKDGSVDRYDISSRRTF
ncbi:UNVERIFIED_CONTAM: hypothetical protein Sangu_2584700 [Sesamum angustifolium]|uniref:DUF4218 domain-containing protein n=1 Tax=Sesamum angustifolium TaxID=2727405 RepID=A0AAW2J668_9LAMI